MDIYPIPQQPSLPEQNLPLDKQATVEEIFIVPDPTEATEITAAETPMPSTSILMIDSRLHNLWHFLTRNPKVMTGLSIVAFLILVAIFGPLLLHNDPNALSSDTLLPPSTTHWLGTTQTGQDIFTQLVYGSHATVLWGIITGLASMILSVIVGLTAGYFGGVVDELLSLLINVFLVLPTLPLSIVLASFIPYKGPLTVALVIIFTNWAWTARILRAQTMSLRQHDFIEAARSTGETTLRLVFSELLPNEIALVVAHFIGATLHAILAEVGLEFIGLGDPNIVSWGSMLYWAENNGALLLGAWWWFIPPGICIALLGSALTLINFGIDEIANPRLRLDVRDKSLREGSGPCGFAPNWGGRRREIW